MELVEEATMLRVYVGESDKIGRHAAYKEIVQVLRREGIWGATATRGLYGYGKRSVLHAASPLRLSEDLPVVVEAVDSRKKIESVIPKLAPMVKGGLIVTLPVRAYVRVD